MSLKLHNHQKSVHIKIQQIFYTYLQIQFDQICLLTIQTIHKKVPFQYSKLIHKADRDLDLLFLLSWFRFVNELFESLEESF